MGVEMIRKFYWKLSDTFLPLRSIKHSFELFELIKKLKNDWRLRGVSAFDYLEVSKDLSIYTNQYFKDNCRYGNYKAVNRFLGKNVNMPVKGIIEHGIYFGQRPCIMEGPSKYYKKIFTYGDYRREILGKNGINKDDVTVVGPYIKFAKSFLNFEEIREIKSKIGKTLLIFPSHSTEGVYVDFRKDKLFREMARIKKEYNFDTVMVSLYYKDILRGLWKEYEDLGCKIVCAGHQFDNKFLERLKSVILMSDVTMSNNLGTHLGYCVALNKPHYFCPQKIELEVKNAYEDPRKFSEWEKNYNMEEGIFKNTFGKYTEEVTSEQSGLVRYYWGPF